MNKFIIDTNIYIDFYNTGKFKEIIYQKKYPDVIYVSSLVIMELLAGAFTKENHAIIANLIKTARARSKIISPSQNDYFEAGKLLAKLQSEMGYDLKKTYNISNDVLIALCARRIGATVLTQNKRDFNSISKLKNFYLQII